MDTTTNGASQWRYRTVAGAVALALVGAACGSTAETTAATTDVTDPTPAESTESLSTESTSTESTPAESTSAEPEQSEPADLSNYPNVVVQDVATGADVELAGLIGGSDRPVLLWFWAPH